MTDGVGLAVEPQAPRVLYGIDLLERHPQAKILIVADRGSVNALRDLMTPGHVPVTWQGGLKGLKETNWAQLAGRHVDIWPDASEFGRRVMGEVMLVMMRMGNSGRIVNPEGMEEGWNAEAAVRGGMTTPAAIGAWLTREGSKYLRQYSPADLAEPPIENGDPGQSAAEPNVRRSNQFPIAERTQAAAALEIPAGFRPVFESLAPSRLVDLVSYPNIQECRSRWSQYGLDTNGPGGVPPSNEDTIFRALSAGTPRFWYDTFLSKAMTDWDGELRRVHDADFTDLTVWFQRYLGLPKMGLARVTSGLEGYLYRNRRNCAQEWLDSLAWDGVPRLKDLLPLGFGTPTDEYHAAVGRNFIMGMVKRVMDPGCQQDYMPIFEGGQGAFKSSALRVIGGEWFTEATDSILTKDFLQNLHGKMLIEISELHAFRKAEQERIKGIITNRVDTYRASYGRTAGDYPRQCVFAGTTNRDDWVNDDTGARRFWRVLTGQISLDWLRDHREQYFAEAVERIKEHEPYWEVPRDVARQLQDDAREQDPWHGRVLAWAEAHGNECSAEAILTSCLEIPTDRQDRTHAARVRSILRGSGWRSTTARRDGRTVRLWQPGPLAWRRTVASAPQTDLLDSSDDTPL